MAELGCEPPKESIKLLKKDRKKEYVDRRNNRVGFTLYLAAFTQQNFTHLFTAV